MQDHMTAPLSELKKQILEDGVVDAEEASQLKERLYADGVIDREEADFMFELNDAVSGNSNDPAWKDLFVQAISAHVLDDDDSPGQIDAQEEAWLLGKLQADGKIDEVERALIDNLVSKGKQVPDSIKNL